MRTFKQWMDLYAVSHQNTTNILIHKICVPTIFFSVLGILSSIPVPSALQASPYFNWATLFSALSLIFYLRLGHMVFVFMAAKIAISLYLCHIVSQSANLLTVSIIVFVVGWIGQFIGHKIEGKKPSFFEDIQFLLIGPIWVIKGITGLPKYK